VTNSTTYHLQDEVLLPWYLHSTPSFSVNGWNTFQNLSAVIPLVVNSPASISGIYSNVAPLSFAPINTTVTGNVVYVGRGCPGDAYLADPSAKIALIDRGTCAVSLKVDAAANAGAIGVLIGLVAPGDPISFTLGGGSNFVPSLVITQANANLIKSALLSSPVNATLSPANALAVPSSTLYGPG
jgi:minor extracellular serine protease Vpr